MRGLPCPGRRDHQTTSRARLSHDQPPGGLPPILVSMSGVEAPQRRTAARQIRWAALLQLVQGTLMEGLPFLGLPVLLLLGVDASLLSRGFSFVVSYFDENLSLMMVMSGIFAGLRIVGAIGLLRDRMWGFALSLVNCTVTLVLMVFMLPAGVADGLLSGAALVLLLMARYGSRRILD